MAGNTNTDILLAGASAAFAVDLLVYPLDTLKTRFQSPNYARLFLDPSTQSVKRTALFRGLYQGVGSVIIATLPSSGAFFTTYEGLKAVLSASPIGSVLPQPVIHSLASGVAELVSCAILTPAEVVKQNAQMLDGNRSGAGATIQVFSRFRANPLALWRGYGALAGRNLPFTALQYPLFERMKAWLQTERDRSGVRTNNLLETGLITAVSAGSAGGIAAVVTTPIDVIKTRIMLAASDSSVGNGGAKYPIPKTAPASNENPVKAVNQMAKSSVKAVESTIKKVTNTMMGTQSRKSFWDIGREIVSTDGYRGLWRGGGLRAAFTVLGSGIYLGVYECGRIWLGNRRDEYTDRD